MFNNMSQLPSVKAMLPQNSILVLRCEDEEVVLICELAKCIVMITKQSFFHSSPSVISQCSLAELATVAYCAFRPACSAMSRVFRNRLREKT